LYRGAKGRKTGMETLCQIRWTIRQRKGTCPISGGRTQIEHLTKNQTRRGCQKGREEMSWVKGRADKKRLS